MAMFAHTPDFNSHASDEGWQCALCKPPYDNYRPQRDDNYRSLRAPL